MNKKLRKYQHLRKMRTTLSLGKETIHLIKNHCCFNSQGLIKFVYCHFFLLRALRLEPTAFHVRKELYH